MIRWTIQELICPQIRFFSESAARTPKEYDWYVFHGKRTVHVDDGHSKYDLSIETKDVYGIRSGSKLIYVVHADDPKIEFTVDKTKIKALLKQSKGYKGKIGRYVVPKGEYGVLDKPKSTRLHAEEKPKPATTVSVNIPKYSNAEDRDLTSKLRNLAIDNIQTIRFIMPYSVMPGEDYHIYDVGPMLSNYAVKAGATMDKTIPKDIVAKFENDVESRLHKFMPKLEFDVTTVRINNVVKRVLVVLR